VPKGDKTPGNLAGLPEPAAQTKNYVDLDGSKFTEGDLVKIGDMAPGTVFKTVSKKKGRDVLQDQRRRAVEHQPQVG
jgi:hypothetical protein